MSSTDPSDSRALSRLTELLRSAVKPPTTAELDRGFNAVRSRIGFDSPRRRAVNRWALLAATLLVCVGVGAAGIAFFRNDSHVSERPVAVHRIEGGKLLEGGYLSESGNAGVKLFFDEGSEFVLRPGARGRLRVVDSEGVRFALEHGTASLRITPSREHRWSVEAGPFLVTVKGTDFTVSWDPASERFELRLRSGLVAISGPVVGRDLVVRPGQKLSVSLPRAETVITEERPEEAAAPASSISSPPALAALAEGGDPELAGSRAAQVSPMASATGTRRRWQDALAKGQWDEILADAERDGVAATLQAASSDELHALAAAARYRRRSDVARGALLAQRSRFPSSARSVDATFLLGRVEESRGNGKVEAIRWYDQYLTVAPAGTYAAEALGRKMILTKEVGGRASALPIAAEYLRRFPYGSYAGAARALQRVP